MPRKFHRLKGCYDKQIVTLHVPDLPSTRNLLDEERIQQMKPSGILINASRGTVVDIDALAIALKQSTYSVRRSMSFRSNRNLIATNSSHRYVFRLQY